MLLQWWWNILYTFQLNSSAKSLVNRLTSYLHICQYIHVRTVWKGLHPLKRNSKGNKLTINTYIKNCYRVQMMWCTLSMSPFSYFDWILPSTAAYWFMLVSEIRWLEILSNCVFWRKTVTVDNIIGLCRNAEKLCTCFKYIYMLYRPPSSEFDDNI